MDHFALPTDDLAVAQREGRLQRNFQGYSTHAEADMVACGVSAISAVGASYSQNVKTLDDYYARLDQGELPIERGLLLTKDDLLRRGVIQMLMCDFELDIGALEREHGIRFADYFAPELAKLEALAADGLVTHDAAKVRVTPKGRLLIRNVCMAFDRYLNPQAEPLRYSKTI
jgi:oxygen-independent coproporphyrinogen-3 oxidase